MVDEILKKIRAAGENLSGAIMCSPVLDRAARSVSVRIITDKAYTEREKELALKAVRQYVPAYFSCTVDIEKLTPDCTMVAQKIMQIASNHIKKLAVTMKRDDIFVEKCEDGFKYTLSVMPLFAQDKEICPYVTEQLKLNFCGEFYGKLVANDMSAESLEVEEKQDDIEYEIPVRTFAIRDFAFLEGTELQKKAVYMADLNNAGEAVVLCGTLEDINERNYTNKKGAEKTYYSLTLSDGTATVYTSYFPRMKSIEKIKKLKPGDSLVLTGKNEAYNGNLRFRTDVIDFGKPPENFVPEQRLSKPAPKNYRKVKPQPFTDFEQSNLFINDSIPDCLTQNTFVVFDLETTGLNSSAVSGNMDAILEIGAYKVEKGQITQSFTTFVNPERRLSNEIIELTGIIEDMIKDAPKCAEVMPDFFKFCQGSILVGHNIAGFDYKFVDYYCAKCGYLFERKLIDTLSLSQSLLTGLPNYKLNTIADRFGITFNHHRAIDDALATAKIFIKLVKIKKSLPKLQ